MQSDELFKAIVALGRKDSGWCYLCLSDKCRTVCDASWAVAAASLGLVREFCRVGSFQLRV